MKFLKQCLWLKRLWWFCRVRVVNNLKSVYWYVTEFKSFSVYLQECFEVFEVRPFRMSCWHFGCNCFTAYLSGGSASSKIFIKMGGEMNLALREAMAIDLVKLHLVNKFCIPSVLDCEGEERGGFIVISFIESQPLYADVVLKEAKDSTISEEDFIVKILQQILDIVDALYAAKVVHRDVRPDNLLLSSHPVTGHPRVTLIDFALSSSNEGLLPQLVHQGTKESFLAGLGGVWKPDKYLWDDAYSFYMIVKSFAGSFRCNEIVYLMSSLFEKIGRFECHGLDAVLKSKS